MRRLMGTDADGQILDEGLLQECLNLLLEVLPDLVSKPHHLRVPHLEEPEHLLENHLVSL